MTLFSLQVVVTASKGFDSDIRDCIRSLIAQAASTGGREGAAAVSPSDVLADVCTRELAALGTILQEDQRLLAGLKDDVVRANQTLPVLAWDANAEVDRGEAAAAAWTTAEEEQRALVATRKEAQEDARLLLASRPHIKETALMFRIEKKILLLGCISQLQGGGQAL